MYSNPAPDLQHRLQTTVAIYCDSPWPLPAANGFAYLGDRTVHVRPEACAILRGPIQTTFEYAYDFLTLVHENTHIWWQSRDEGATDCFALFVYRYEAKRFGATLQQAQVLYDYAWSGHKSKPANYQGTCTYLPKDPIQA